MSDLKVKSGDLLTANRWNTLCERLGKLSITQDGRLGVGVAEPEQNLHIAYGTRINGLLLGSNIPEVRYPWNHETVGVSNKGFNLRLQSPNSIFFHTDVGSDESANATKIPLTILKNGNVGVGTAAPVAKLQIIHQNQNANGGALIVGPTNQANLRLGYDKDYSWIQSHGSKPLLINPLGNTIGIGTTRPTSPLTVRGVIECQLGGFKFPDGSLQTKASAATNIRTGTISMNTTGSWKTSPLATGTGTRNYYSPYINLSGFTTTPHIMYSIYRIDAKNVNQRIRITPSNVSRTRFRLCFTTWSDSEVYDCDVRWMAIGK